MAPVVDLNRSGSSGGGASSNRESYGGSSGGGLAAQGDGEIRFNHITGKVSKLKYPYLKFCSK